MVSIDKLQAEVKKLLEEGKIKYFIGYEKGPGVLARPAFVYKPEKADRLTWSPGCVHNLSRFIQDEKRRRSRQKNPDLRPIGLVVKGCDSRAVNVLLQEKYIERQDVFLLGVSCEGLGVIDEAKLSRLLDSARPLRVEFGPKETIIVSTKQGEKEFPATAVLADRCLECPANFPVVADLVLGEKIKKAEAQPYQSIAPIEKMTGQERWQFWQAQFPRCVRCYACRSVCPMCYCDECVADSIAYAVTAETTAEEKAQKVRWVERSPEPAENIFYHLVRAIHLAGRCVDCGECERVCPVGLPLRLLNKKLEKEAKELFGYEVGFDPNLPPLISCFRDNDPQDFIR